MNDPHHKEKCLRKLRYGGIYITLIKEPESPNPLTVINMKGGTLPGAVSDRPP